METLSLMLHISDKSEISSGIAQAGATGVGSEVPAWVPGRVFFGVRGIFGLVGPSSSTTTSTSWYSVSGMTFLGILNSGVGSKSSVGVGVDLGLGLGLGVSERTSLTDSSSGLGGDLEMQRNCSELCFWDWVALFSWLLTQQPIVRCLFPFWEENGGYLVKALGVKSD